MYFYENHEILRLEPLTSAHARIMYPKLLNKDLYRYIEDEPPRSIEELKKEYENKYARWNSEDPRWRNWIILIGNKAAGYVQATIMKDEAILGWVVFNEYQGKGVGANAVSAMIKEIISDTGIKKFICTIEKNNIPSRKLARKLDFNFSYKNKNDIIYRLMII